MRSPEPESIRSIEYNRVYLFALAVILYLLVATLTERELSLSVTDLADAACGAVLAALIVFYGLPQLLYRDRYLRFALLCLGGVALFGFVNEWLLDPLLLEPGDPRIRISRWGAVNVMVSSFSIAAIVAMFDNVDYQRRLRYVAELRSEAELAALKSQLNPHIVLNTLNNLYALTLEGDSRAPDQVLMLADILRYSLYETEGDSAPLAREVEILASYVALQEVGIGERADIRFDVRGQPDQRRITPLLLLPLVENAFKHGSAVARNAPLELRFRLTVEPDSVTFETENPVDAQAVPAGSGGIGLGNLRERLNLAYPGRHELDIRPGGDVYRVTLRLTGEPG